MIYSASPVSGGYEIEIVSTLEPSDLDYANPKGVSFVPDDAGIVVTMMDLDTVPYYRIDPGSRQIDPVPRQVLGNPDGNLDHPEDVTFSPDGRYCAVANAGGNTVTFHEYDREAGLFRSPEPVLTLGAPEVELHYPHGLSFSPDGRDLLVSDYGYYPPEWQSDPSNNRPEKVVLFNLGSPT